MNGPVILIPLAGITLAGVVVGIIFRYARHSRDLLSRERLAAVEKGLDTCFLVPPPRPRQSPLFGAMVTMFTGAGLTVFLWRFGLGGVGLLLACIGLGMFLHWFVGGRKEWERQQALDEELSRAYIERLRVGTPARTPEAGTPVDR